MNTDRITEIALALVVVWMAFLVTAPGGGRAGTGLADVRPAALTGTERERFDTRYTAARQLVDTNRDAGAVLTDLVSLYPGRHEGWALRGRWHESKGDVSLAVRSYATAIRLEPDYLDEGSPLYLGRRIERLTNEEFTRLSREKESGGISRAGKTQLKVVYFLRRRLAGGCE